MFNDEREMTTKHKDKIKEKEPKNQCGLCGKTKNLIKTDCCGNWICNDERKYIMFSYARNSCYRNHSRFTLCGYHHTEKHPGHWKDCKFCKGSFMTEMYVWYGTNKYNFEKLKNPPVYEPTHCTVCGKVIVLGEDGYAQLGDKFWCEDCHWKKEKLKGVERITQADPE